jgi:hypothetical protein
MDTGTGRFRQLGEDKLDLVAGHRTSRVSLPNRDDFFAAISNFCTPTTDQHLSLTQSLKRLKRKERMAPMR